MSLVTAKDKINEIVPKHIDPATRAFWFPGSMRLNESLQLRLKARLQEIPAVMAVKVDKDHVEVKSKSPYDWTQNQLLDWAIKNELKQFA